MDLIASAKRVIDMETRAVASLHEVLGPNFEKAIEMMMNCQGRIVTTGMGKAGHIAKKIAATLASTGAPSFFMHPAEAIHGDLGMITENDIALLFSHSGQTDEMLRIIPYYKHIKVPMIAITSNPDSELAKLADVSLILQINREACPFNLAPTSSTTAMLALGDTLALVLLEAHGFKQENYALLHPGGSLGRRLLIKVSDLMHKGEDNPIVKIGTPLSEAILVMTSSKLAATSVVNEDGTLAGIFVDGDLRRLLMKGETKLDLPVDSLMTKDPKFATPDMMAVRALEILREYKIIELPVCDENHRPVGMIHLHDITRAGIR